MAGIRSVVWLAVAVQLAGCRGVLGIEDPVVAADARPSPADGTGPDDGQIADALPDGAVDAAPAVPSIQYLGQWSSGADVSTYVFPAVPLGAAALDRHVIVVSHGRSPQTALGAATVTIGASPVATRLVAANELMIGGTAAIHIAAVPDARTTADITLSFAGGLGDRRAAIGVWVAYGLTSAVPVDTVAVQDAASVSQFDIDLAAGGLLVTGATIGNVQAGTTAAWVGVGEAYDLLVETTLASGGETMSTAADMRTVTFSAPDSSLRVVAASFR